MLPCGRNDMFLKKVVSLSHKTPTFGSGFADRKSGGQKKVLKTQGFSMFFFDAKFWSDRMTSPTTPKNTKYQFYLDETLCYAQKIKKTQYFWLLFGTYPRGASCLDNVTASYGFHFLLKFQSLRFRNKWETNPNSGKSLPGHQNTPGNTKSGNTKWHQRSRF